MSEQVRHVTNEQRERVGVLLDLEAYNRVANPRALNEEFAKIEGTRAAIASHFSLIIEPIRKIRADAIQKKPFPLKKTMYGNYKISNSKVFSRV